MLEVFCFRKALFKMECSTLRASNPLTTNINHFFPNQSILSHLFPVFDIDAKSFKVIFNDILKTFPMFMTGRFPHCNSP